MARSRNIKPGFFKNYELADCGPYAQLLFAGLWCLADKDGKLEDKPRLIKAELFPYYDVDVNRELTVIERLKFIYRFQVDGIKVIQIANFKKHQKPHHTEKASTLPDYVESEIYEEVLYNEYKDLECENILTVDSPLDNREYLADSLNTDSLIPDSLNTDSRPQNEKPKAQKERFKKPTQQDLYDYKKDAGLEIDTQQFFDFYESKGWMVGKTKMKCWKSSMRNWSRNNDKYKLNNKPKDNRPTAEDFRSFDF